MYGISYPEGKGIVVNALKKLLKPNDKILDVGAGSGTYWNYMGKDYNWTAVEIWADAAENLKKYYDKVYNVDIRNFTYFENYKLIIFGDVLEHLTVDDAQAVLFNASHHADYLMVAVPFKYPQGPLYGNEAERHLQPDLTNDIFNQRYPGFMALYLSPMYGYYLKTC